MNSSIPKINPDFARFVVKVEPPLPPSMAKNKTRVRNIEAGKTTHGQVRKLKSKYGNIVAS